MRFAWFLLVCLATVFLAVAQEKEIDLEEFAERLFQIQEDDISYEDIYESLFLFYTSPLDLNSTNESELSQLYLLSPVQIESLLSYIEKNGPLISIYELQGIENFDISTIRNLLPFVRIGQASMKESFGRRFRKADKFLLYRQTNILEKQRGFRENAYEGSRDKIYSRLRVVKRNDFSFGATFEKDAGEVFGSSGFDFYSFHFLLENQGPFSKILVGDFQLQVGQGLVMGAGFNPGKGAETVFTVKRNTLGIRPYTSVLETGFFRGVALSAPLGNLELTAFVSGLAQDGNVQMDTLESAFESFISSIQSSGFHRTESELASKDQIDEFTFGGMLKFQPNRRVNLGVSALSTRYSENILRNDVPYNFYEFKGKENSLVGVNGSFQWQSFNFFGEVARSSSGGYGAIGGVIASLSRSLDLAISLRDYSLDFHSFYGNAFGEGSRAINEKGTYWGIKFTPSRKYAFVAYYDKFRFPWLRFGVDAPSQGAEWLGRFTYNPARSVSTFVQVREELREVSVTDENLSELNSRIKRNYIVNISYKASNGLKIRSRVQASTQTLSGEFSKGYAIVQDVSYSVGKFSLNGRVALFETDDYDNRQYVYESDVLYAFSIPAYNGSGVRNYILAKYRHSRQLDFWIRYGRYSYRDRDVVGTGLDESQGPFRTELKWMMRYRF